MSHTPRILVVCALVAACGGQPTSASRTTTAADDVTVVKKTAVPRMDDSDTRWAEPGAGYVAVFNGLIDVASISKLPSPTYPGRDFQYGVFEDAASWAEFTGAARMDPFGPIDWTSHAVVYTVLDLRTNLLGLDELEVRDGRASMEILWVKIEPQWDRASPAVLTLVEREQMREVQISVGELPLGTLSI